MAFDDESCWKMIVWKMVTAGNIEHTSTAITPEVVMMFLIGEFEPTWFSGQIHGV
jgi:hypothetical protein